MKTLRKLSKIVYNKQCSMFKRMHRIKKNSIMREYLWVKALSLPACAVFSVQCWGLGRAERRCGADITNYKWPSLTLLFQMAQINLAWSNTLIAAIIWRRDLELSTLQLQQSLSRWAAFIVQLQSVVAGILSNWLIWFSTAYSDWMVQSQFKNMYRMQ